VETIAVYWEPRVKTYGFNEVRGLVLMSFKLSPTQVGEVGFELRRTGQTEAVFFLVLGQSLGAQGLSMQVLVKEQEREKVMRCVSAVMGGEAGEGISTIPSVGLIHFYGPHFGDRYGIADSVFDALGKGDIPVLAAGCSASSVYLVLPGNRLSEGGKILGAVFDLPES
jgi:hypothetical protein